MATPTQELKLLAPLSIMFVLVLLLNTLLRDLKDSLGANHIGANSLPSLKAWAVTPASFGSALLYEALRAHTSSQTCFNSVISAFAAYYALFCFVLFPLSVSEQPCLDSKFQVGAFFVIAELWATVVVSLLFWSTASEYVTFKSASRLFPKIGLIGQLGPMLAGQMLVLAARVQPTRDPPLDGGGWLAVTKVLGLVIVLSSVLTMLCYHWLHTSCARHSATAKKASAEVARVQPPQSWWRYRLAPLQDKTVQLVVIMVASYGVSLNMVEVPWRAALSTVYKSNAAGYSVFMGTFWTWTGAATACSMVASSLMLPTMGFKLCVMSTPIAVLLSGLAFFWCQLYLPEQPALLTVLGAAQSLASKACKYSMFDTTKQIAFLAIDPTLRDNSKTLIEIVGYRWSKFVGAIIIEAITVWSWSVENESAMLGVVFVSTVGVWLLAAYQLGMLIEKAAERGSNTMLTLREGTNTSYATPKSA